MRPLTLTLVALLALPLAGCWSFTPAHPRALVGGPAPIPADAWPKRDPEAVRPIFEATPDKVFGYRIIDGVDPATLSEREHRWVDEPEYVINYKGLHAGGLLRIQDEPAPGPHDYYMPFQQFM